MLRKLTPMKWFIILAVITCALALGLPPDPQTLHQLHASSAQYRLAILVLLLPFGIIWYAAFYAFGKLKEYTHVIRKSEDGKAFRNIMIGVGVLAFGFIVPTILSLIMQFIVSHHHAFKEASVIINNYFGLLVALATFAYIGNGTHSLAYMGDEKTAKPGQAGTRVFGLIFITLSVLFAYVVIHNQRAHGVYYLNTPVLIVTFIIPSLFAWFMALVSAYELTLYTRYTEGLLYRGALRKFSLGIIVVIIGSVTTQVLNNTSAHGTNHSLGYVLVLDYLLLILFAAGLILMARGTKQLKKIEEV